jgi:hypothetical protein
VPATRITPRLRPECAACQSLPRAPQLAGWRLSREQVYAAVFPADAPFSPVPFAFLRDDSSVLPRSSLALKDLVLTSVAGPRRGTGHLPGRGRKDCLTSMGRRQIASAMHQIKRLGDTFDRRERPQVRGLFKALKLSRCWPPSRLNTLAGPALRHSAHAVRLHGGGVHLPRTPDWRLRGLFCALAPKESP